MYCITYIYILSYVYLMNLDLIEVHTHVCMYIYMILYAHVSLASFHWGIVRILIRIWKPVKARH